MTPDLFIYSKGYEKLLTEISGLDQTILKFKPTTSSWSIHEIIVHLADSEAQSYVRFRTIIADSSPLIANHDENAWSDKLLNANASLEDALMMIKLIRKINYLLLTSLSSSTFNKTGVHSIRGNESLFELVQIYTQHIGQHIKQIQRNIEEFKSRN
ncbi:MAG: hypothetical protein COA79_21085 [Planctomycetota bacterium]|nr:MAG: hypothetical protein COA79_21085 [Planctomycetota bacterium]